MGKKRALNESEKVNLSRAIHLLTKRGDSEQFHGIPALRHAFASLVVFVDEGCPFGTAYTDCHFRVGIHPKWLQDDVPVETLAFLIAHECLHSVQRHDARVAPLTKSRQLSNVASDLEINEMIVAGCLGLDIGRGPDPNLAEDYNKWLLIPGFEWDEAHGFRGICLAGVPNGEFSEHPVRATAEQHLDILKRHCPDVPDPTLTIEVEGGQGGDGATGGSVAIDEDGDVVVRLPTGWDDATRDKDDPDFDDAKEAAGVGEVPVAEEARIRDQVAKDIQDHVNSHGWGNADGWGNAAMENMLRVCLKCLTPPVVDWRRVLETAVSRSCAVACNGRSDYSYRRVNRRHLRNGGPVLPGFIGYAPKVAVALDTSGSMGNKEYSKAVSELSGICQASAGDVGFFCVDTEAKSAPERVRSIQEALSRLKGGGGTDMSAAVEAMCALDRRERPDVLVIATDGYFDWGRLARSLDAPEAQAMQVVVCYWQEQWDPQGAMANEELLKSHHQGASVVMGQL